MIEQKVRTDCSLPDKHLAPFEAGVLETRWLFLDHLKLLPTPQGQLLKYHYLERVTRSAGRPMLGEYSPFLVGEIFQAPREAIKPLSIPWFILYEHALLMDDLTDRPTKFHPNHRHLAKNLIDYFLPLFQQVFVKQPDLETLFNNYYQTPSATKEAQNELVKFLASAICIKTRGRVLNQVEEAGLKNLYTGVQLLDDLTDVREDYKFGTYTYPLSMALRQFGGRSATANTVDLSRHHLREGIGLLDISSSSVVGKYLTSLTENSSDGISVAN